MSIQKLKWIEVAERESKQYRHVVLAAITSISSCFVAWLVKSCGSRDSTQRGGVPSYVVVSYTSAAVGVVECCTRDRRPRVTSTRSRHESELSDRLRRGRWHLCVVVTGNTASDASVDLTDDVT